MVEQRNTVVKVHGPKLTTQAGTPLSGRHEWVSFADPRGRRTWVFDVSFLESNWLCVYGRGCQGVLREAAPELEQGCCSYGVHFSCDDDAARVEAAAERLTAEDWQFKDAAAERGGAIEREADGGGRTRLLDDACIFLNRPGFAGGAGCALHYGALRQGEQPLRWKPDTCWQIPFRVDQTPSANEHVTLTLRQWERGDWGMSGYQFHWWCTEPDAFVGAKPVHEELRNELMAMVGPTVHSKLEAYLDERRGASEDPGETEPDAPQSNGVASAPSDTAQSDPAAAPAPEAPFPQPVAAPRRRWGRHGS